MMSLHSLLCNISKYWSIDCEVLHWWSWLARGYKCILRRYFSLNSMPCSRYPFIEHQKGWKMLWVITVPEYPSFIGHLSHFCSGKSNDESITNIRSKACTVNAKVDCFFAKSFPRILLTLQNFIHAYIYVNIYIEVCAYTPLLLQSCA